MRGDDIQPDDRRLTVAVQAAQDGDEAAFRTVYRAVHPRLLGYVRTLVSEPDVEDVTSEAWLQITRDLSRFSGDADRFRGWAARIARNRALDHIRMRGRRPAIGGDESELADTPGASDTAGEALEALGTGRAMRLIAGLPQDQAEAVVLRVVVGLDAKNAARVLGKRPGAVRTAAHRGLRRLAELIGDEPDRIQDGPWAGRRNGPREGRQGSGRGGGEDGADQGEGTPSRPPAPGPPGGGGTMNGVPVQGRRRRDGVAESYVPGVTETAARTQKDM
ncbi:RNA polymerase sigma-70 factor, ECF subfamily [Streptomyces sp. 2112.3]|uniref:RNA polymerase sigma factor n=1 Tax=Streptomyces sp. 2112.3 TaxID=1881023 RepID=UPI000895CB78|nr:RNA polymerase sigma factor [Streptomyces sp. 2112.3]SEE47122.1 RNA polymerase sigma-70 factor, ECF subfamily [Streptomyces sp. 2112.3]